MRVSWVSDNDASVPKPCLTLESSSNESFVGRTTAIFIIVVVQRFYCIIINIFAKKLEQLWMTYIKYFASKKETELFCIIKFMAVKY